MAKISNVQEHRFTVAELQLITRTQRDILGIPDKTSQDAINVISRLSELQKQGDISDIIERLSVLPGLYVDLIEYFKENTFRGDWIEMFYLENKGDKGDYTIVFQRPDLHELLDIMSDGEDFSGALSELQKIGDIHGVTLHLEDTLKIK